MKNILLLNILGFILLFDIVLAQTPDSTTANKDIGWAAIGIGPGVEYDYAIGVSLNYGRKHILQGSYHGIQKFTIGDNPDNVNSVSLSYGFSSVSRLTRVAFFIGPAYVFGKTENDESCSNFTFNTIGLQLSCQAGFTPVMEIGLGLDFFININHIKNIAGVALTIFLEGNK